MRRLVDRPGADDDVAAAFEDRADQGLDVRTVILVVRVGIDDDIRPVAQAGVQAGREKIPMDAVNIRTNGELRPSRLFHSMGSSSLQPPAAVPIMPRLLMETILRVFSFLLSMIT